MRQRVFSYDFHVIQFSCWHLRTEINCSNMGCRVIRIFTLGKCTWMLKAVNTFV